MKKATKASAPSRASLRELPAVAFGRYRVRRNPYAARIAREGSEIVHEGPSAASLADIPEATFTGTVRRNPYVARASRASRAADAAGKFQYGRGRPRAGEELGPTPARSLRLPQVAWDALEQEAREKRTTVHALLRELVALHLKGR